MPFNEKDCHVFAIDPSLNSKGSYLASSRSWRLGNGVCEMLGLTFDDGVNLITVLFFDTELLIFGENQVLIDASYFRLIGNKGKCTQA